MPHAHEVHVYIDESGDAGFKFRHGSSRYFVMAAVIFESVADQMVVNQAIADLRTELGFTKNKEFRFNDDTAKVCEAFCRKVRDYRFTIRALVINKTRIINHALRKSAIHFYQFAMEQLLINSLIGLHGVRVVIDGMSMRDIKCHIRDVLNAERRIVACVEFADSRFDSLVQLADMVASGIARSCYPEKGRDHDCYRKLWKRRIEAIYEYDEVK